MPTLALVLTSLPFLRLVLDAFVSVQRSHSPVYPVLVDSLG